MVLRAVSLGVVAVLVAGGCSTGGGDVTAPTGNGAATNANTAPVKDGGSVTYVIEKDISSWNVLQSGGNGVETGQVMNAILPSAFVSQPDFTQRLNSNILRSAKVTSTDPQTVVYQIREDASWNDGTPVNAKDFTYSWQVQDPGTCKRCTMATSSGYDDIESVTGSAGGNTVTVTFDKPFGEWQSLFRYLLPAHIAERQAATGKSQTEVFNEYFATTVPTWSAGPFQITKYQQNVAISLERNPRWRGEGPHLKNLVFRIITDAKQEPTALANGEVDVIYPQPQVDLVGQISQLPEISTQSSLGLSVEAFWLNLKSKPLGDVALRRAIFTAVDRKAIIAKTVGQFSKQVKPDNSRMYVPQQDGYEDTVSPLGGGDADSAKAILEKAGYRQVDGALVDESGTPVPPLRAVYTVGNDVRKDASELLDRQLEPLGIDVRIEATSNLGETVTTGDYDIIVYAPNGTGFPVTSAAASYVTGGGENYGGYSNPTVDKAFEEARATIDDPGKVAELLNKADRQVTKDAYMLPLYQKPTFLAFSSKYGNLRDNPTASGPSYNIQQWGIKKDANG